MRRIGCTLQVDEGASFDPDIAVEMPPADYGLWHDLGKYSPAFQQYLIVLGRLIRPQVRHARDSFQKISERHSRKHLRALRAIEALQKAYLSPVKI